MIIDLNASLGHYPFRRLRHRTAGELVRCLDRQGIDRAVVTSLHSVFYRDAHRGNEELWTEAKPHAARLIPVATANPRYVGWERDLAEALETWGMKAVALWPEYHGYALSDRHGQAALTAIAERGVPLMLVQRLEDRRQRHTWDRAEDLAAAAVLEAARQHPRLKFLLVNWAGLDGAKLAAGGLAGRCLIDFARLQVVFRQEVPKLLATLGAGAVAFGSHLPFDYAGPSLIKLANLAHLPAADFEKIAWRNAADFLGL
jgi:predicted TIM-barrel fold metal-dependent hydrolase